MTFCNLNIDQPLNGRLEIQMNKIWIGLFVLHGCVDTGIKVEAFKTEAECNKALDDSARYGKCASVDYLLQEKYGTQPE